MKVAIILNGQWRESSLQCSKWIKELFQPYNPDYFVHTWEVSSGKPLPAFKSLFYDGVDINTKYLWDNPMDYFHNVDELKEEIQRLYSPIELKVSTEREMIFADEVGKHPIPGWLGWWSAWEGNKLKKEFEERNGFKYDIVIRMRPDIIFPKYAEEIVHQKIKDVFQNGNHVYTHYRVLGQEIIDNDTFPIIDYYQISTSEIIDWLHSWVDIKIKNSDYELRDLILQKIDNIVFNVEEVPHPQPIIIRDLFSDEQIIEFIRNTTIYPYSEDTPILESLLTYFYEEEHNGIDWGELFDYEKELLSYNGVYNYLTKKEIKKIRMIIKEKIINKKI